MEGTTNNYSNLTEIDKLALRRQRFEAGNEKLNTLESAQVGKFLTKSF
jgi:hypothetical protein